MRHAVSCLAAFIVLGVGVGPAAVGAAASDSTTQLQDEINAQLAAYPGGVQVSPYEVAYDDGNVIVTFALPGENAPPTSSTAALRAPQMGAELSASLYSQEPADVRAIHGCPTQIVGKDWYCFYEHRDWNRYKRGRRVQWNAKHCDLDVDLWSVGFGNQASSWVNGGALTVQVYQGRPVRHDESQLWRESPHHSGSWVGDRFNDKADSFTAC